MITSDTPCPDYYYTLNVPPSATVAQVERAYWRIVRSKKPEEDGMDDVNEAYSVLASPRLREQYDKVRDAVFGKGTPPQPPRQEKSPFKAPMAFMDRQRPQPRSEAEEEHHPWRMLNPASWLGWLRSAKRRSPAG